ncbi:YkgJ family cysteine cluster protein [Novosphingobium sp.]|uniref:YkgJ family cysteine cluster protein n=1 Tax=Novosphingobium sp. TaxID=1874826 RepID=UPI00286A19FB|nr:YkgJ family cysteine cluster protein [Novosphingobium sp.]
MSVDQATRRFACTQCGKCCNRAPEVELGEAAALADVFVWQLLFRRYSLPRSVADYPADGASRDAAAARFFESRKLLGTFAAHAFNGKAQIGSSVQQCTFYLTVSALAFDPVGAGCPALSGTACSIYERRPLTCRSVPLHYSRAAAFAADDLDAFVATPGFACATHKDAPLVLQHGVVADPGIAESRAAALAQAQQDAPWKAALVKAMKHGDPRVPSLAQVEQAAARGALTVPMLGGWEIAAEAGLLEAGAIAALKRSQDIALDRLSAARGITLVAAQAIAEQRRALA